MSLDFSAAKTQIANTLGKDDPSTLVYVGQCLDVAQRDVARSFKWPELHREAFFNTAAEYHTGTVAVTLNSATVTGTATVFPALVAEGQYRFALGAGSQWYGVASRGGDTALTLAQPYVGASASGLSYSLYDVVYPLAADVGKVEGIWLHDGTRAVELLEQPSEGWATDFASFPSGLGTPSRYCMFGRSADDEPQVMLGPSAPDAVYRCRYTYRKRVKDGEFALSEPLVDIVVQLAQALAYRRDHYQRYVAEMRLFRLALLEEIAKAGDSDNIFTLGEGRVLGTTTYLQNLLDFGTVSE